MAKILLNEQIASELLFEHLKESEFESGEYNVFIPQKQYILQGSCTLLYNPTQPTLTEIVVDEISLINKISDEEVSLDADTLTETLTTMITDYTYEKNRTN